MQFGDAGTALLSANVFPRKKEAAIIFV
jgi:hypothetical protein